MAHNTHRYFILFFDNPSLCSLLLTAWTVSFHYEPFTLLTIYCLIPHHSLSSWSAPYKSHSLHSLCTTTGLLCHLTVILSFLHCINLIFPSSLSFPQVSLHFIISASLSLPWWSLCGPHSSFLFLHP